MKNNNFNYLIKLCGLALSLYCTNMKLNCSNINNDKEYSAEETYGRREAWIKMYVFLPHECKYNLSIDDPKNRAYLGLGTKCTTEQHNDYCWSISHLYINKRKDSIKITVDELVSDNVTTDQPRNTTLINDKERFEEQKQHNKYLIRTFKKFSPEEYLYIVMYDDSNKEYSAIEDHGYLMDLRYMDYNANSADKYFDKNGNLLPPEESPNPLTDPQYYRKIRQGEPLFEVDPARIFESEFSIFNHKNGYMDTEYIATLDDFIKSFGMEVKKKNEENISQIVVNNQIQDDKDVKINQLEAELHDMKNMMAKMMEMMVAQQSNARHPALHQQTLASSHNRNIAPEEMQQSVVNLSSQKDSDIGQCVNNGVAHSLIENTHARCSNASDKQSTGSKMTDSVTSDKIISSSNTQK